MQVLEDRVPFRPAEMVDLADGVPDIPLALHAPGRKQRGGQIGDRPVHGLIELAARRAVMLLLDPVHAQHQPAHAVVLVGAQHAVGELHRFLDLAADDQREKGAIEQVGVLGVVLERVAVIVGGRHGVAHLAGMSGGEITAGTRHLGLVGGRMGLGVKLDRRRRENRGKRGAGDAPGEARRDHWHAPMGRMTAGPRYAAEFRPRMAFLRRPRKNGAREPPYFA